MAVFELNVLAEESQLIPLYFVIEIILGQVFFKFINSYPWKIFASEGRFNLLSFDNLVFEG